MIGCQSSVRPEPNAESGRTESNQAEESDHSVSRFLAYLKDKHPEIYEQLLPAPLRPLARVALAPLYRDLRAGLRACSGLVGITPSFLAKRARAK